MQKFSIVLAAVAAISIVVSGTLWNDLRSSRRQVVDLQERLSHTHEAELKSAQRLASPHPAPVLAGPPPAQQLPERPPQVPRTSTLTPPVVSASVPVPLASGSVEERRADALRQSDQTAMVRVRIWSGSLSLSPEQLQALNKAAMTELRRETEESLEIDSRPRSMDAQAVARLKEETINRQHETNLRILDKVSPQLSAAQINALRGIFDAWVTPRLAAARAERERTAAFGQ